MFKLITGLRPILSLRNLSITCLGAGILAAACGGGSSEGVGDTETDTSGSLAAAESDPDYAEIHATVDALGLDTEAIEIDGNVVRVEDMILYRDTILAGGYGPAVEDLEDGAIVDKGYKAAALVSQTNVKNIKLVFGTGPVESQCSSGQQCEVPTTMRNAFRAAAIWDWSGNNSPTFHNTKIDIAENNTGPTITIRAIKATGWPNGSNCSASSLACAELPSNNKPGANLWIRSSLNPFDNAGQCHWVLNSLTYVANHELGHTLGVNHPKVGTQVAGTAACTPSSKTAEQCLQPGNAGYATVMTNISFKAFPDCGPTLPFSLQADDLLVATKLYPNN